MRRRRLVDVLRSRPDLTDVDAAIASGRVLVDGAIVTNPASLVLPSAAITVSAPAGLRGERKLSAALTEFGLDVSACTALDAGAAAGGFTRALLSAGATRVYAVDAGHGQLLGSLRQDTRVVNLEATNLADLDTGLVPDAIDVVTLDLSYLSLAAGARELSRITLTTEAQLVGLVKPMFELGLADAPTDAASPAVAAAVATAVTGVEALGWHVLATMPSPVTGARGAVEAFLHAVRH